MITVIMQHEVKDFSQWKVSFDADEPNRSKVGVKQLGVYTSVKNPNDVTMIFEAPSVEVLETFTSDPRLQQEMQNAGVISVPVTTVLKKM
ncbi:MAG: DUF3764 family protein [Aequorivita antarctica]